MKLIISPSSNMVAFARLIEQQERIAKTMAPALTMNNSILNIARYYENLNKNKSFQISFTISDTIKDLINQTSEITNRYSKYYNQLNDVVRILNPSLTSFLKSNSSSVFNDYKTLNPIDFGIINSFESVNNDYDETTQTELEEIKGKFDSQIEFKEAVSELINESTSVITTDIYLKFSQIIEKYVGIKNARTIALFLSLLLTIYFVVIPLYQNFSASESEHRQNERIENMEKGVKSEIENSKTEILDKFKDTESQIDKLNEKMDEISKKLNNDKK